MQELRKNKRRPAKAERQGLFSGLLYCADCGGKLHFATCKSFEGKQDHYVCSKYKSGRGDCSAHYIREDVLREPVLRVRIQVKPSRLQMRRRLRPVKAALRKKAAQPENKRQRAQSSNMIEDTTEDK